MITTKHITCLLALIIYTQAQQVQNSAVNPCVTIGANSYYQGDLSKPCASTTYYNDAQGGSCACCTQSSTGICETFPWAATLRVAAASPLIFGENNDGANTVPQCCTTGCGTCYKVSYVNYSPNGQSTCLFNSVGQCESSLHVMIVNSCFDLTTCPPTGTTNPSGMFAHIDILNMDGWLHTDYGWANPVVYYQRVPCNGTDNMPTSSQFSQCQATCKTSWGNECAAKNPLWVDYESYTAGAVAESAVLVNPVSTSTTAPTPGNILISLNSATTQWWIGMATNSPSPSAVTIMDAGMTSFSPMTSNSWGYWTYNPAQPLTPPISFQLTYPSGLITLTNVITSLTQFSVIDTGFSVSGSLSSSSSTPSATTLPATNPPTPATASPAPATASPAPATASPAPATASPAPATASPTSPPAAPVPATSPPSTPAPAAPASASSGQSIVVSLHPGSSTWWMAVDVSNGSPATVQLMDSGSYSSWNPMIFFSWGAYTFSPNGIPLTFPVTVLATSSSGQTAQATFASLTTSSVNTGVTW